MNYNFEKKKFKVLYYFWLHTKNQNIKIFVNFIIFGVTFGMWKTFEKPINFQVFEFLNNVFGKKLPVKNKAGWKKLIAFDWPAIMIDPLLGDI